MALATLCATMGRLRNPFRPQFHAFVVDHGARPESQDEAQIVVSRLKDLGVSGEPQASWIRL